jgi:hypothetical protein
VFGKRLNQELLPLEVDTVLAKITGFVGKPTSSRKKGAQQYFFVNNRYMKHPYFHKAVQNAYDRLVPVGEQVPYFIYFDVPTEGGTITVNMESNVGYDVSIPSDCDWITLPVSTRGKSQTSNLKPQTSNLKSQTRAAKTTAVVLRVSENTTYKERDAVVTISNKEAGVSVGIYIHQPFETVFNVDKAEAEVPMDGGTVTATVESNVDYNVSIPSDCKWITLTTSTRGKSQTSNLKSQISKQRAPRVRKTVHHVARASPLAAVGYSGIDTGVWLLQSRHVFRYQHAPHQLHDR